NAVRQAQGKLLSEIPTSYLCWLLREVTDLAPYLKYGVQEELKRRGVASGQAPPPPPPRGDRSMVDIRSLVKTWFRELSLRWHPDRGGGNREMMVVNDARERLCKLLGVD